MSYGATCARTSATVAALSRKKKQNARTGFRIMMLVLLGLQGVCWRPILCQADRKRELSELLAIEVRG